MDKSARTLPGAKATAMIARHDEFTSRSYGMGVPFVMAKGRGVEVWDVDGNRFLDFTSGVAVTSTGHAHPTVVQAVKDQADKFLHISTDFYVPVQIECAEMLAKIAPGDKPKKVFLGNSGTEAVEGGFKLAKYATGRPYAISFIGAFHGRTYGSMSLSNSKTKHKKGFAPVLTGIWPAPYPYCYRCQFNLEPDTCDSACVSYIEDTMFRHVVPPEEVAAIVGEPIQGEGGYIVPPEGYWPKLKALAEKYGIFLQVDEVQSGMGRTGKMFAIEHWGVVPEIVSTAKGIASGLPLGAFIAPAEIMDTWQPGSHGNTFGGNPLSCAAAIETIKLLKAGLIDNARVIGDMMLAELKDWEETYPFIGQVRGKGLMIGIEFVKDKKSKAYNPELRDKVADAAFYNGLITLACGTSSLRLAPPLILDEERAREGLSILRGAIEAASKAV